MADNSTNINKRIAKNTLALYFRTFITMFVGIYSSRVLLQALGVENYGINAVIGGIVGMSSLITGTMSSAISRYLTFYLGKGEKEILKTVFSTAINAQIAMSVLAVVALEIVGVWFLNTQANIPDGRMYAANWVLQCSILTLIIGLISSPYNALIVAHEHMGVYAYTSIADAVLKLLLCFAVMSYGGDKLIFMAMLNIAIAIGMRFFYGWYCGKRFEEAHYCPKTFDKALMKELTAFSGWTLFGQTSWVLNTQGITMLVNVFFGVVYNAAQGVANTINACIESFVSNFVIAFNPQIIKLYANKDYDTCYHLVNRGCRLSWMLMMVFTVPVFIEADKLLAIWLVEVPDMASIFLRFALFNTLALKFSDPLHTLIQANGDIKLYLIHSFITGGIIFPATWIVYSLGAPVWATYPIAIAVRFCVPALRLYHLKRLTTYQWRTYITDTAIPCISVLLIAFSLPLIITFYWEDSLIRFLVLCPISVLWTASVCFYLGLTKHERAFISEKIATYANKLHK